LPHSLERGFIERRYRSQHAGRFDPSRRVDNRFEMTTPCTRAARASAGYSGIASITFTGALMPE
jgi:hypothetical protein